MATLLSYALTTLADVKESLAIASGNATKDNLIIRKINQATQMIEGYCALSTDHHFKQAVYTNEEYDGSGTNEVVLKMRPVTTFTSLDIRTTTLNDSSAWETLDTSLYFVNLTAGVLELNFTQSRNWKRYRVTYTAGYATIPADLAEACASLAAYLYNNAAYAGAIRSKQEGNRRIDYYAPKQTNSIIDEIGIADVLDGYINYQIQDVR